MTRLGIDEARVLADPPQPGALRVNPLLNRTGVDVRARSNGSPPVHASMPAKCQRRSFSTS